MKIIGLAGGSGVGKGTVCALFEKYNFAFIDTDALYHELTSKKTPCLDALTDLFGECIIGIDGALDRRVLASVVFAKGAEEKLQLLNATAHRFVLSEVRHKIKLLRSGGYAAVLVDAPLLFESGFDKECDIILCVIAEKNVRISRIIERDKITREAAEARISAQVDDAFLKSRSDYVIENNSDLAALEKSVDFVAKQILE